MAESATVTPDLSQNPYVGPRAFEEAESDIFFGRDEEIEILTSLVMTRRLALFYAQSGAGKSSLLRAGLVPELTRQRTIGRGRRRRLYQKMQVLPIATVGGAIPKVMNQPIANIYIFSALYAMQPDANPGELAGLSLSEGLTPFLTDTPEPLSSAKSHARSSPSTLLIFDQFEEVFTSHTTRWSERKAFFQQVRQALDDHDTLHVLFTMREDFIAELTPYLNLMPEQLRDRFRLERLKREAAIQAIKEPAVKSNRIFADGVAEELVDNLRRSQAGKKGSDVVEMEDASAKSEIYGAYVEPVHLQIVCRQLWDKLPEGRDTIEAEDVQKFGDVDEALIGFYEDTLQKVIEKTEISERMLRVWFGPPLITSADTRGLVYRGETETEDLPNEAVDILEDAYIIRRERRGGDIWYELTHDRLVEPILKSNRLGFFDHPLIHRATDWANSGENPDRLLSAKELLDAAQNPDDTEIPFVTEYIKASESLESNKLWFKDHSFVHKAYEWANSGRNPDRLLRVAEYKTEEYENQIKIHPLVAEYIRASNKENLRQMGLFKRKPDLILAMIIGIICGIFSTLLVVWGIWDRFP